MSTAHTEGAAKDYEDLLQVPSTGTTTIHYLNASGQEQELDRTFTLFSLVSTAITTGNVYCALAGTIVVALYNGGPAGIIY